ncbi:carboxynorspermidine decarboxylase [Oceanispirochaeta crateris]|uniref:Carboxynorspermidine/carboxyspermidine decarboxylase n=1 Tax=Oceanispirochaeta crateris TaxID=2518645 RepID=A0A5C1QGS4_9SPIO|nr:carboxynorspermidine decarboxylase [Oceanispirochaeta crateris]QEN06508.1 carboxynorspermidine decarboxylase [Oceanispirochaeta crateris]
MDQNQFIGFNPADLPTPCFVIDEGALRRNLSLLKEVQDRAGCTVLLALKAFACWPLFPLIKEYLPGICASGPHEARLGREEFGGQVHTYSPGYTDGDLHEVLGLSDHVIFNSFHQWNKYKEICLPLRDKTSFGLRLNPRQSEAEVPLYDPSSPGSRLGIIKDEFRPEDLEGISGFHFHNLCEQDLAPLKRTLKAIEDQFGPWIKQMKWVNFGGGHHISKPGYDREGLIRIIRDFRQKYGVEVILEPGEAIAIHTGVLVTTVLDVVKNEIPAVIMDASVSCHMPDVIEMPYRPEIWGAGNPGEKAWDASLGGRSCLAGDSAGIYSFEKALLPGDRLVFDDMSHYTMVKTTTFNGVPLPSIALYNPETRQTRVIRRFGYDDFKGRLG